MLECFDSCVEELSLVLSQSNDPLLLLELGIASHEEFLADLSSLENNLEGVLSLGNLFKYVFIKFDI